MMRPPEGPHAANMRQNQKMPRHEGRGTRSVPLTAGRGTQASLAVIGLWP